MGSVKSNIWDLMGNGVFKLATTKTMYELITETKVVYTDNTIQYFVQF